MSDTAPHRHRLITGMPDKEYRDAPGVNQTSLKTMLDCPARYRWEQDTPQEPRRHYDEGHVVHALILGNGLDVDVHDFRSWESKAAKSAEAETRAAGRVPILAADYARCVAMADQVRAHPVAGPLLTAPGDSEVSMFWEYVTLDGRAVPCKGRVDRVVTASDGSRFIPDLKTTARSAAPASFARAAGDFGYHLQAAFYTDGYESITGQAPVMPFVVVEKKPPHLVSVVTLGARSVDAGRAAYEAAIGSLLACREAGEWPGYTEAASVEVDLPPWHLR